VLCPFLWIGSIFQSLSTRSGGALAAIKLFREPGGAASVAAAPFEILFRIIQRINLYAHANHSKSALNFKRSVAFSKKCFEVWRKHPHFVFKKQ
jgi:hypothetical protein